MRRLLLTRLPHALIGVAAVAVLTSCGSAPSAPVDPSAPNPPQGFEITDVDLGDGQSATCITWESGNGHEAGLDCQWPDRAPAVTVDAQHQLP